MKTLSQVYGVIKTPFVWVRLHALHPLHKVYKKVTFYFNKLESQYLIFNRKHLLLISLIMFLYLWLKEPITHFYDDVILLHTLGKLPKHPLGEFLGTLYWILLIALFYIIIIKFRPGKFKPVVFIIFGLLFFSVVYWLERFQNEHYLFQRIYEGQYLFSKIALLDPIAFFALSLGLGYLLSELFSRRNIPYPSSFINPDHAIVDKSEDEFERAVFVDKMAVWLNNFKLTTDKSFVIGINGRWGFGKSSLMQMIAADIRDDIIKVKFNPWIANKDYNLIKDFFNTLEQALSQHITTSNIFRKYGKKLTKVDDDRNPFKSFKDLFDDEPLQKCFEKLTSLVRKINKRVYVFIDDIDRLNKEEVYEILRLIRSSACFSNLIFIIAYDRAYVEEALGASSIPDSKKYLEKIIQLEIKVPAIPVDALKNAFVKELKRQIEASPLTLLQKQQAIQIMEGMVIGNGLAGNNKKYGFNQNIPYFFQNKRDIVRFTNALILKLSFYFDQVYMPDLFLVELIRLFLPALHDKITFEANNFVYTTKSGTNLQILTLEKDPEDTFMLLQGEPQAIEFIEKVYIDNERIIVRSLMDALISEPLSTDPNHDHGIYYRDYYESYFTLVIPSTVVNLNALQSLVTTTTTTP